MMTESEIRGAIERVKQDVEIYEDIYDPTKKADIKLLLTCAEVVVEVINMEPKPADYNDDFGAIHHSPRYFRESGYNQCLSEIKSKLTSRRPNEDAHGAGKEIIKMETFESWLQDHHCRTHPEILDDDLPDAFSDWLVNLDPDEWIELGDKYGKSCRNGKGDI